MLVVLPPSETKVSGGLSNTSLSLEDLSFPLQNSLREELVTELQELSRNEALAMRALGLGPKSKGELERNVGIWSSPILPAIERYNGVLFDALDPGTLDNEQRRFLFDHVAVFSALFGLIRASDPIPAYRLSFDSSLPGGKPGPRWRPLAQALWAEVGDFVIDLRSEGYQHLAPVAEEKGVYVALTQPGPAGARKALGHANKSVKGQLMRALVIDQPDIRSVMDLVAWGETRGYAFDETTHHAGRIDLVVSGS